MALKYRPEIDGLRSVAVLPVILFHAGIGLFSGGYVGVDVFFVISGYLISSIIFGRMAKGTFSLVDFYDARARRILPALFFVMIACLPLAWLWMNPRQWTEFSESMIWTSLFSSNIFFWLNSDYFASASEFKPLLHTWSLAVEEQYYVFFPLIVMAFWRFGKKFLLGIFVLLGIASFAFCLWQVSRYPEANFFLTPSRVWELLAGVACAAILMKRDGEPFAPGLAQFMSFAGLAMILFSIVYYDHHTPFPSIWAVPPVLGTTLIVLFAGQRNMTGKLLSIKPLVWIGLISYSAYLWHQPLFAFARIRVAGEPELWIMLVLALLSLALAYVSWRWVEQPFRKKKTSGKVLDGKKFLSTRKGIFSFSLAGLLAFIGLGYVQANGYVQPERLVHAQEMEHTFKRAGASRGRMVRYNSCHFNAAKDWKGKWNCEPGSGRDKDLEPVGVGIFGDSHSADKAMMLRSIGYSPMHFGGGGCQLLPTDRKLHCKELAEFALERMTSDPNVKEIWLSSYFNGFNEKKPEYLLEAVDYWSQAGKPIVLFNQMPIFDNLQEKSYATAPDYPELTPDFEVFDMFNEPAVRKELEARNVLFVDMVRVICIKKDLCDFKDDEDNLLYVDKSHLSLKGARASARRLQRYLDCKPSPDGIYSVIAKPSECRK